MKDDRFDRLLAFLERLDKAKLHYILCNYREDAISVEVYVPGEHWEVDFLADGEIELERYRSSGEIEDQSVLEELLVQHTELDPLPQKTVNQDDTVARK